MMTSLRKGAITTKTVLCFAFLFCVLACTKRFTDINTPTNIISAGSVNEAELGQAFAQCQYHGMFLERTSFQVIHALYSDLYAQYFSTTHPNFPSDQFLEVGTWTGLSGWNYMYSIPAPQVYFVEKFTADHDMALANAIAKVWRVHFYHRITDRWGPIIYSQFGNGKTSVGYDSQKDIYHDFFTTLDTAVAVLKQHPDENAFGSNDQIFGGKANLWLTFANTLRLRLAMRIAYVESALAKEEAEKAFDAGVMTKNEENADVLSTINSLNGYTKITYIDEFRMSATMESVMGGYNDPRISDYFDPAVAGGGYKGLRNGLTVAARGDRLNIQAANSFIGIKWRPLANGGTNPPTPVLHASEAFFLRAEGALRGWKMGGTAKDLYEQGIKTSMNENGAISTAAIDAYITSLRTPKALNDIYNTPAMSDIPVAFLSSRGFEKQLEQIITQKWIAMYPNSDEAWAERRRTGYPVGFPIIQSLNAAVATDKQMRRLTFAEGELSTNAAAVELAKRLLGGPDNNATRLWWDAK